MTPDGERIAVGMWGVGGQEPELVLLDRDQPAPIYTWSMGGSVLALDLDPSATRIAVCLKDAHANEFATTGTVTLVDTGERDLQLTSAARPGSLLELAYLRPEQVLTLFCLGLPRPAPLAVPGVQGVLQLDLGWPVLVFPALPDGSGRADADLLIPSSPVVVGLPLAVQTASLAPSGIALSQYAPRLAIL